jgi:hypothetical protein
VRFRSCKTKPNHPRNPKFRANLHRFEGQWPLYMPTFRRCSRLANCSNKITKPRTPPQKTGISPVKLWRLQSPLLLPNLVRNPKPSNLDQRLFPRRPDM